jgi:hypothetical protein
MQPRLGIEDGSSVALTAIAALPSCVFHEISGETTGSASDAATCAVAGAGPDRIASTLHWAPIRLSTSAETVGLVVCTRLQPSQDPVIAVRRLNEVCRVLAVLLSACPESVAGEDRDGGR